jgi:hypothetical protein
MVSESNSHGVRELLESDGHGVREALENDGEGYESLPLFQHHQVR